MYRARSPGNFLYDYYISADRIAGRVVFARSMSNKGHLIDLYVRHNYHVSLMKWILSLSHRLWQQVAFPILYVTQIYPTNTDPLTQQGISYIQASHTSSRLYEAIIYLYTLWVGWRCSQVASGMWTF